MFSFLLIGCKGKKDLRNLQDFYNFVETGRYNDRYDNEQSAE